MGGWVGGRPPGGLGVAQHSGPLSWLLSLQWQSQQEGQGEKELGALGVSHLGGLHGVGQGGGRAATEGVNSLW